MIPYGDKSEWLPEDWAAYDRHFREMYSDDCPADWITHPDSILTVNPDSIGPAPEPYEGPELPPF